MTVFLCLSVLVIVALAFTCLSLFRRLKALEQRITAQHAGETKQEPDPQAQPLPPAEEEAPLVSMPPLTSTPESTEEEEEEEVPKRKLVVVDDSPEMRKLLERQLSADFEVLTAENGEQGLALTRENRPAMVVSDVRMPVMTGYELCHAIRQDAELNHIPVILLSALSERENIIYGLEAGAADYIVKPFDMSVLRTRIRSILKHRKIREGGGVK